MRLAERGWRELNQLPPGAKKPSMEEYCRAFNERFPLSPRVTRQTLTKHCASHSGALGRKKNIQPEVAAAGRPPKLPLHHQRSIARILHVYDYGNSGQDAAYVCRRVLVDAFGMGKKEAKNFWYKTLRHVKDEHGVPMLSDVVADKVTKKRTAAINEENQRHFFKTVDHARALCASRSTGVDSDGKTYADLEEYFVGNIDEVILSAFIDLSAL